MCLPSAPSYTPPAALTEKDKPQEVKQTSPQNAYGVTSTARKGMNKRGGGTASTLLTGPSGIENSQLSLGKTVLLGQ